MKHAMMILLLLPASLWAQPFQQETNTIPVEIYGWHPFAPWVGGFSTTIPELCDIDGDGDLDFFEGMDFWTIAFFQNNGTAVSANFDFITYSYQNFVAPGGYTGSSSPEYCDIDADGDQDAFIGGGEAYTSFYRNNGTNISPNFELEIDSLRDVNGDSIRGEHPQLVDIDADNLFELFVDRYFGIISLYDNVGTADSFAFQMEEYQFDSIDAGSMPKSCFVDLDADGDYDLLIGNEDGHIQYYQNMGDSMHWTFQLISTQYDSLNTYERATPVAAKIDGDDDYDLFSGRDPWSNSSPNPPRGDIFFWENQGNAQIPDFQYVTSEYLTLDEGRLDVGDFADIDADGHVDMLLGSGSDISFYENVGSPTAPSFILQTEQFAGLSLGGMGPVFYNLDDDGDLDLANSEGSFTYARVRFYQNIGTPQSPSFQYWFDVNQPGALAENQTIADIDGDGDGDLFFTDGWSDFYYFENTGTAHNPAYTFVTQNFQGISNYDGYPTFVNWDGDGDLDLFLWGNGQNWNYFENIGSPTNPQFVLNTVNYFGSLPGGLKVSFADIDADGDQDAFFTGNPGGVVFLRNLAVNAVPPVYRHPPAGMQLILGPNPANPITVVSCKMQVASDISLEIFDISGRKIVELASGFHLPGAYRYAWDASKNASGMYIIRLKTPQESLSEKLTIIK